MEGRSFTDLDLFARLMGVPLRALKRLGVGPVANLPDDEIRGTAHMLGCGILGTVWQRRHRALDWNAISRAWDAAAPAGQSIDPSLYGTFSPNDRLTLLTDNEQSFIARDHLYERATKSIDLATYYFQADEAGQQMARALIRARQRGVRVRLCADAYITHKKDYQGKGILRLVHELRAAGVEIVLWNDPSRPYDTNHRKMLLVDDQALVLGGRNIADHYAQPGWRDVDILIEGPSASEAVPLFERTFHGIAEPPRNREPRFLQATTPANITAHSNFVYLLQCVKAATRTIDIENAYYLSHPALVRQLDAATKRGVRVRIFTNSAESNDLDFANYRLYMGFFELLDARAELYLRRGKGKTLHCKYFVVDGEWVSLGSSNLDYYSPRYCTEANLHARNERLGAELTVWFEQGIAEADRLTNRAAIEVVVRAQTISRGIDLLLHDVQ